MLVGCVCMFVALFVALLVCFYHTRHNSTAIVTKVYTVHVRARIV